MSDRTVKESSSVLPYASRVRKFRGVAMVCLWLSFIPEITDGINLTLAGHDMGLPVGQEAFNLFGFIIAPLGTLIFAAVVRRRCNSAVPAESSVIASTALIVSLINLVLGITLSILNIWAFSQLYRLDR